jgi:hypothetical protein
MPTAFMAFMLAIVNLLCQLIYSFLLTIFINVFLFSLLICFFVVFCITFLFFRILCEPDFPIRWLMAFSMVFQ